MQRIKLILPTAMHKEQVAEYKREFELHGDSMDGTSGLSTAENFEEWLKAVEDNLHEDTVREGLVPASTYLAIRIDDGKLVGMIQIRHELNDYLMQFGGHIGYSVRKSERRKGFAKEMLKLALMKCKDLKIERALVTCDKENIGSAKTILGNGGVLENEVDEGERITQRYWIKVSVNSED
jgi:predicted acetyltransferase